MELHITSITFTPNEEEATLLAKQHEAALDQAKSLGILALGSAALLAVLAVLIKVGKVSPEEVSLHERYAKASLASLDADAAKSPIVVLANREDLSQVMNLDGPILTTVSLVHRNNLGTATRIEDNNFPLGRPLLIPAGIPQVAPSQYVMM